jgi:hypothetical protein
MPIAIPLALVIIGIANIPLGPKMEFNPVSIPPHVFIAPTKNPGMAAPIQAEINGTIRGKETPYINGSPVPKNPGIIAP